MLDVRRLEIFVAVAEEGTFTAAAQRLYLTQSAVSQQMSALEREVGVSLLRRVSRGVTLTPAGEVLAARAKGLFSEISTIEQEVRTFADGPQEIRLGAFTTVGVELLPAALKAFAARRPDVRVVLRPVHGEDILTRLRQGDIHVLLVWDYDFAPRPVDSGLSRLNLPDDPLRVVLPVDHPLAGEQHIELASLAGERWVVRAHRAPYENAYETMCRIAGFEPDIAFRTDDYQPLQGLVAAGMGVSLVPGLSLVPHRDDIVSLPLGTPAFSRRVTAVTLADASRSTPVAEFLDVLRASASLPVGDHSTGATLRRCSMNARIQLGWSGHARPVNRWPSTTAAPSTNSPPAAAMSGASAGYAEDRRPCRVPAAASSSGPWHSAATGMSRVMKCRTMRWASRSLRMYSGARPPGTTAAT